VARSAAKATPAATSSPCGIVPLSVASIAGRWACGQQRINDACVLRTETCHPVAFAARRIGTQVGKLADVEDQCDQERERQPGP
jgi:hypothetical protein